MNTLGAYTSYPVQSAANPFALFGIAQSPRETCEAYRTAELEILAKRTKCSPAALKYDDLSLEIKSDKSSYATISESRKSSFAAHVKTFMDDPAGFSNMLSRPEFAIGILPTLRHGRSGTVSSGRDSIGI
ncbi:hypothetical protein BN14_03573 [Rhizoctonia solani AG-1 IB]|uniref:Uncharacterized protein n=1 Tax=Thanatephorus cucumeris (strain AG1-IB / isolate 7/3/14) TaxID=1108050 RepID=M5C123_THACB|nr:hypothetical protein BN14_03573 [Rhizoctonia solani AG-1 IB]